VLVVLLDKEVWI